MIWKTTIKKITGLTFAKSITLAFLAVFLFNANNTYAQFVPDGDYSASEYEGGQVRSINNMPSETCFVEQVYSIVKSNSDETYLLLGFYNGNGGQATFRYYLDTDPDLNLGSETFKNKSYDFPGADVVLQVTAGGSSADVFKYNGSSLQPFNNSDIVAEDGDFGTGDGKFIEIKIPLSGDGSIINICDLAEDFTISLGSYISFAGNSTNAKVCDFENIDLDIAVNGSIDGSTSYCTVTNSTTLTLSGDFSSIKRWEKQEVGSGWVSISNTSNTYTATNVSVTTSYRAIIVNNTCPDNEVETGIATITINETPVANISNNNGLSLDCNTPSTTLTASGGTSYAWTNSNGDDLGTDASITVSTEDTFTVTVTAANGCTDTESVSTTLDNTDPTAVINNSNGLALNCTTPSTTLTASGGTSYAWTNSNGDDLGTDASITVSTEDTFTVTVTAANGCTDTESVSTTLDNTDPTAVINNNNGLALNCTTPSTTLTASGGTSYAWTNSNGDDLGADASITVSTEDTFTVTVTAANGCTDTESVSTTLDNTDPTAVINNNNGLALNCTTPSTTLTASGGTSYAWTNSNGDDLGTDASITVSTEDTFTVTVSAANGCTDTESVSTTLDNTDLTAVINNNNGLALNCTTPSTTFTASGGTSYAWTNSNGDDLGADASITVSTEDTFTVTVTAANGCTDTESVSTTLDNTDPTAVINNNNGLALNCTTPSTTFTASGGTSYAWTNSNGDDLGADASITVSTEDTFTVTVTAANGCTDTESVSTTLDNTDPTAVINNNNGLALNCTTPSTTLTASGGTSYAWTNSNGDDLGTDASITVSTEDTFTVTVTAANGCTDTESVSTTLDNTDPTAVINNNNGLALNCTTPSTTLTASGGTSYAWTNSNGDDLGTDASITVSTEDTFTVTVTAANGCTDTESVSTTLDNTDPTAVINNNNGLALNCTTPSTTLTASGGTSYAWTNSNGDDLGTGASITVSTEDTFTVTVTAANGCTDTESVSTTLDNTDPTAVINNNNGLALNCTTPSTTLTASGGTSYAWTNSNGDDLGTGASITVSTEDTFTVTVTAANGCTDTESVSTTLDNTDPTAVINNNNGLALNCTTPSTTLTASGGTSYAWTNSNGDDLGNDTSITVSTEDTFTVTVTAANGCTDTESVSTTLDNTDPTAVINNNNGLALNCTTPSTTLTASGGTSYAWTNSNGDDLGTDASITVSTEDTFTVTVTTANGCTDTESVSTIKDASVPTTSITGNQELNCTTTEITLDASGSKVNGTASYSWTMDTADGDEVGTEATLLVETAGTYFLTVTDTDNGCTATNSVTVTQDITAPTAEAGDDMELTCTTTSVTLNGSGNSANEDVSLSYAWTGPGEFTSNEAMPSVSEVGTYTLTVTDNDNGCFATDSVEVTQDITAPTAEAGDDMELTCTTTSVTLNGSGSSNNDDADLSYAWNGPGKFTSEMAMPSVSVIGTYTLTVTDNDNACFTTDTVEVTQDITAPTAEAGDTMELTCTTTSVTLNGSGSSNNDDADLSYAWNGPGEFTSDTAMPAVTVEGIYTLTVTDNDNGCFATDSVEVTKDANVPTAAIAGNEELNCTTTEITLDASGSTVNGTASYSWTMDTADGTEVGTEATLLVETAGTYFLTVTDTDNGCTATNSVTVTQDITAPTAEAGNDMELTCTATSVTLNGSGSSTNDDASLSYAWTGPGEFTSEMVMPSVSVIGTYTLTVTDNDNACFTTDTVEVTQDITAPTAEAGDTMELTCTTTSVTLNGSGSSNNDDADLSYTWTGPGEFTSEMAMPSVSVVGTYTLTVTDNENGCFVTDTVEVTQDITAPTAEAGDDMELTCTTTSVTLNGSGNSANEEADLSYAWTGPGEFTSDQAMPSVTVEGTYTLTVTDNDNGCFASDSVEVTKDANVPTASIGGNEELNCTTTAITLDASGSTVNGTASYSWTMDTADGDEVGTEATLLVETAGTYFLTVTDTDNGCTATNSVTVTQDITAPTAEAGDDMELTCTATSVTLNGSGSSTNDDADLSYAWTGPGEFTSEMVMPSVSVIGTYTLTVTDNDNGCFTTDTVEVTQDITAPTAEAGETKELTCTTTSVTLNGSGNSSNYDASLSYAWTGPGEFTSEIAMPAVTVEGTYTLTVTDNDNGCFATDSVEVTKDANVPTAAIGGNEELNCTTTAITLDASGSTVNGTASYSWTMDTADGNEVGTEATLEVTTARVYFLTVTDLDNGCTATNSVEVIFTPDTESPVITECASEVNVSADAGVCDASEVDLGIPTASDNCDTELTYENDAPEVFPLGQTIVTWTITDASNNSVQCGQIVNVTDDETPVIDTIADINVDSDIDVCGAVVEFENIIATDNCEIKTIEVTEGLVSGSVYPVGTTTVTITVTDMSGNTTSTSFDVNVTDNEAPEISCSENITVDTETGVSFATVDFENATATDNCEVSVEQTGGPVSGSQFEIGTTTITFTATDAAGNTSECSFTITVEDNEDPTITCPADIDLTNDAGVCGAVVEFTIPEFSDNSGFATIEQTGGLESGDVFPVGTTTVSYTVTDEAGNSASCSFDVTVIDSEAPVVEEMDDITVNNDNGICGAVVNFNTVEATDNCEIDSVVITEGLESGSEFPVGTTTVTYTVTDVNGNMTTESFTVTVVDNEAPEISCPTNITVDTETGVSYATVDFEDATATDNCEVSVEQTGGPVSGSQFEIGTTTITFTATDSAGNTSECSFTITVEDNEDPTITCPADIDLTNDAGVCGAVVDFTIPEFSDNSGFATIAQTAGLESGDVFPVGITTVSYAVTDEAGNSASCSFDVIITDSEAPVVEEMDDITVNNDNGICGAVVNFNTVEATDNCEVDSVVITEGLESGSEFPVGTTTVTYTVTDINGNVSTESFTVTVVDNEAPEISCPTNSTVDTETGVSFATVDFENATATDNCEVSVEQTGGPVSGSQFEIGTTTITFTATDAAGNTSECSFTVTVEDNEDPTISCPSDISGNVDAGICEAAVNFETPAGMDNSGNVTVEQTAGLTSGEVFPVGTTTITFTATDAAGNSVTCSFDITVTDDEAPVVEEMDDITVNNNNGICGAVVNFKTVEATDNCEVDSVVITEGLESGSEFPVGTTTVTYTVTDINGNVTTESFTVTVVDNEAPEISCPTNITVDTETGVSYATVDFEDATATDNCEVSVEQTGGPVSGSQFEIGTTTITFTATDAAGNTSECSFTVTVEDNEDPTISCPSDISGNVDAGICEAAVNFETPAGMDNSGNVTVEQTAGLTSGEVFPVGTTTITFTATDAAGNSVTCSFDITVTDDEAPVIEEMENIVMNTDNGICGAVVDFIAPSATDNCEVDNVTLTEGLEPGTVYPVGVTDVTYTATDNSGNTASTSFTVTVIDNEAPSIECPENVTVTVENGVTSVVVNYEAVTTIDNCEGTTVELTSGIASGEEFPVGETEVTYTVTDASGNSTTCSFTVTVEEEPAPAPPPAPEVDVTQATCAVPTGTITVTVINGLTYSIDGENYQADGIFDNLTPGTYDIVAQDESGQISEFTTVEINDPVAEEIDLVNNGVIDLCTEDSTFDLFELFAGDYDDTGVWIDTNNTGALDNGFIDPSMLAVGSYTFEYQIDGNCPSTTQVSVLINDDCIVLNCSVEDLKDSISNAVTPNGDNINDFFEVDLDTECGFTYDLKIFNRWGAKVFDAQNYQNNWDGYSDSSFTSSNQLPSGTYFYVLEIRNSDFEPIQGYIYLGTK